MRKRVKGRFVINWIYAILLILVIFSNVFSAKIEILLRLSPDIPSHEYAIQVHVIDVGQGDAIAINFPNDKVMLIDSGTKEYRSKLSYYLDNVVLKNTKTIDYVVLTHPDIDHSSNMQYILENYNVKNFYRPPIYESYENKAPFCVNSTYKAILQTLENSSTKVYFNEERLIEYEDYFIQWLDVLDMQENIQDLDTNSFSPVIIISNHLHEVMFTGDIDNEIEEDLITKYGEELDVDILKLAHHGSKYSTSYELLLSTSPEYLVTSVGENSYGHPANDTLQRILDYDKVHNTQLFDTLKNTNIDGNIVYTIDEDISINTIKNIDDYNFTSYWMYSIILIIVILYFLSLPYYKVLKKNIRFIIQNRKFEKMKEKERFLVENSPKK